MRITIEPTVDQSMQTIPACTHHKVTIELPYDDLSFDDMVDMFKQCMHGMGYAPATVEELNS